MKTITISAIDPNDDEVRENKVLVSRIVGWCTRGRKFDWVFNTIATNTVPWSPTTRMFSGPTTIISLDSGAEYEIAESVESFQHRLGMIVDAASYGFTGFIPQPPFAPSADFFCVNCGDKDTTALQLTFPYYRFAYEVAARDPAHRLARICKLCIIHAVVAAWGCDSRFESKKHEP